MENKRAVVMAEEIVIPEYKRAGKDVKVIDGEKDGDHSQLRNASSNQHLQEKFSLEPQPIESDEEILSSVVDEGSISVVSTSMTKAEEEHITKQPVKRRFVDPWEARHSPAPEDLNTSHNIEMQASFALNGVNVNPANLQIIGVNQKGQVSQHYIEVKKSIRSYVEEDMSRVSRGHLPETPDYRQLNLRMEVSPRAKLHNTFEVSPRNRMYQTQYSSLKKLLLPGGLIKAHIQNRRVSKPAVINNQQLKIEQQNIAMRNSSKVHWSSSKSIAKQMLAGDDFYEFSKQCDEQQRQVQVHSPPASSQERNSIELHFPSHLRYRPSGQNGFNKDLPSSAGQTTRQHFTDMSLSQHEDMHCAANGWGGLQTSTFAPRNDTLYSQENQPHVEQFRLEAGTQVTDTLTPETFTEFNQSPQNFEQNCQPMQNRALNFISKRFSHKLNYLNNANRRLPQQQEQIKTPERGRPGYRQKEKDSRGLPRKESEQQKPAALRPMQDEIRPRLNSQGHDDAFRPLESEHNGFMPSLDTRKLVAKNNRLRVQRQVLQGAQQDQLDSPTSSQSKARKNQTIYSHSQAISPRRVYSRSPTHNGESPTNCQSKDKHKFNRENFPDTNLRQFENGAKLSPTARTLLKINIVGQQHHSMQYKLDQQSCKMNLWNLASQDNLQQLKLQVNKLQPIPLQTVQSKAQKTKTRFGNKHRSINVGQSTKKFLNLTSTTSSVDSNDSMPRANINHIDPSRKDTLKLAKMKTGNSFNMFNTTLFKETAGKERFQVVKSQANEHVLDTSVGSIDGWAGRGDSPQVNSSPFNPYKTSFQHSEGTPADTKHGSDSERGEPVVRNNGTFCSSSNKKRKHMESPSPILRPQPMLDGEVKFDGGSDQLSLIVRQSNVLVESQQRHDSRGSKEKLLTTTHSQEFSLDAFGNRRRSPQSVEKALQSQTSKSGAKSPGVATTTSNSEDEFKTLSVLKSREILFVGASEGELTSCQLIERKDQRLDSSIDQESVHSNGSVPTSAIEKIRSQKRVVLKKLPSNRLSTQRTIGTPQEAANNNETRQNDPREEPLYADAEQQAAHSDSDSEADHSGLQMSNQFNGHSAPQSRRQDTRDQHVDTSSLRPENNLASSNGLPNGFNVGGNPDVVTRAGSIVYNPKVRQRREQAQRQIVNNYANAIVFPTETKGWHEHQPREQICIPTGMNAYASGGMDQYRTQIPASVSPRDTQRIIQDILPYEKAIPLRQRLIGNIRDPKPLPKWPQTARKQREYNQSKESRDRSIELLHEQFLDQSGATLKVQLMRHTQALQSQRQRYEAQLQNAHQSSKQQPANQRHDASDQSSSNHTTPMRGRLARGLVSSKYK